MPFAHIQALVAGGHYFEASQLLRMKLDEIAPREEGIFFPRGLYADEALLYEHVAKLEKTAADNPDRAELRLLLGYQLFGLGKYDRAIENLQEAKQSYANRKAASQLIEMLQKVR